MTLMTAADRSENTESHGTDPRSAASLGTWERVCATSDLEAEWGEVALLGARQVAVVKLTEDEVYAVSHVDPHTGANVMARGIVGSRGDRPTLASPLHKEVYDLGTGECFTDPNLFLQPFRTRVVGGFVEVELVG